MFIICWIGIASLQANKINHLLCSVITTDDITYQKDNSTDRDTHIVQFIVYFITISRIDQDINRYYRKT